MNSFWKFETEHFYFDVYRAWKAKGQSMFRAGVYIKKCGNKKYSIDFALFAEWDYMNAEDAFEHAKNWIMEYIKRLTDELGEIKQ